MDKEDEKLLNEMYESLESSDFPGNDLIEIQDKFISNEDDLIGLDFNNYCLLIAGSLSYAAAGKKIPKHQRNMLKNSFFDMYPQYKILKNELNSYKSLIMNYLGLRMRDKFF